MFCLMLLLFGAVVFISGTDPKKLKDFINKKRSIRQILNLWRKRYYIILDYTDLENL